MPWSDQQLASHKKAQAGLSASAAILGVGALGAKGVGAAASRAAKGTGFAAKSTGLRKVPRGTLKRVGTGANRAAEGLSYGSIGVGGASGLNFAGVSSAEAKRVRKNDGGAMDFGLSGVHQHGAQEISKAGGLVHVPRGFTQGRPNPESVKSFTKKRRLKRVAVGSAAGATGLGGSAVVYDRHRKSVSKREWSEKEQKLGRGAAIGAVGGLLGPPGSAVASGYLAPKGKKPRYAALGAAGGFGGPLGGAASGALAATASPKKKKVVAKRRDSWMNISEHEQRAKNARRRGRNSDSVAGLGVLGAGVSAGLASNRGRNVGREMSNIGSTARAAGSYVRAHPKDSKTATNTMGRAIKANRYGAGVLAGAGLAVGATAAGVGHGLNERHHTKEIGRLRKKRAQVHKALTPYQKRDMKQRAIVGAGAGSGVGLVTGGWRGAIGGGALGAGGAAGYGYAKSRRKKVTKAYDPERNRERRMRTYEAGLTAGATGAAAAAGYKAAPITRSAREMYNKGELNRGSLKKLGHQSKATAALGLGAVGAAYGANRVSNYRRGAGRPYKPLRGI